MTQNDESTTSGYEVDASTEWSTNYIWRAFDNDVNTYWHADYGSALWNSSGDYVGTVELITGHKGDWITVKLPTNERISPRGIRLSPRGLRSSFSAGQAPKDVVVIGSNDGSSWVDIATTTLTNYSFGISPSTNTPDGEEHTPATFDFEATEYYQYVGIIIKSIYPGGHTNPSISQLEFLGIPEYDSDAHGTDVVVKSEANVPNTDWLEVYYEGKNYTNGAVQDETGNNRNGTLDGVTYDSVSESFTFVSGNKITAGPMTPFTSGTNYTASMWFKVSEIVDSQKLLFHFGHGDNGQSFGLNIQNGNVGQFLWGGSTKFTADNLYTANEWVHAVGTINGSTAEVYVNGHLRLSWAQDVTTTIPTNPYLSLGIHFTGEQASFFTGGFFTGSIANFRLFNRALASDEIWQLYAYQKEYFGHGDLSMTLKAGRLGIGTSEPRAMLDVRGDMDVTGDVNIPSGRFTTHRFMGSGSGTFEGSGNITLPFDLDYGPDVNPNIGWEIRLAFGASGTNYGNCSISGCYDNEDTLTGVSEAFSLQLRTDETNWTNHGSECFLSRRETVAPAYQAIIRIVNPLAENIPPPSSGTSIRWHFSYECTGCYAGSGATTIRGGGYFLFGAVDRRIKRLILNSATGSISGHYNFVAIS